jgi:hypothetical protein
MRRAGGFHTRRMPDFASRFTSYGKWDMTSRELLVIDWSDPESVIQTIRSYPEKYRRKRYLQQGQSAHGWKAIK